MFVAPALRSYFGIWLAGLEKFLPIKITGMKILEQRFGSDWFFNLNEPNGRIAPGARIR